MRFGRSLRGGRGSEVFLATDGHDVVSRRKISTRAETGRQHSACIHDSNRTITNRREILTVGSFVLGSVLVQLDRSEASDLTEMEALKGKDYGKPQMSYADFVTTESGLQYKDLQSGKGSAVQEGDEVVIDWDGYTIGYYGRPFEARNKVKGGAFVGDDKDFLTVKVGAHEVIPGFEEALYGMKKGGIRRIIVPLSLGYPNNSFKTIGPKPTTFSGQRALSFVIENQGFIDKTLLFDIEIIKII